MIINIPMANLDQEKGVVIEWEIRTIKGEI